MKPVLIARPPLPIGWTLFLVGIVSVGAQNAPAQDDNPVCSTITVSCPSDVRYGDPITFTAKISGGDPNVVPAYEWNVAAGRIIAGQRSSAIRIDTTGFGGQAFTATVSVRGYDKQCPATASATLIIEYPPGSYKVDSYGTIPRTQEINPLRNFAVELRNQPSARGYLLVYGGSTLSAEKKEMAARAEAYLLRTAGIEPDRIVSVDAGFREKLTIDLWLVPLGANPPTAEPTVDPPSVKITKAKTPKR